MAEQTPAIEAPAQGQWPGAAGLGRVARRRLLLGLGALAVVSIGGLSWYWQHRPTAVPVKYVMVKTREIVSAVSATGQVEAMQELDATVAIGGILQELLLDEGATVQRGQPVARLFDTEYRKKLHDAEAELQKLQAIDLPQARSGLQEVQRVTLPQAQIAIRQAQLALLDQERNVQMTRQLYENQAESKMNLDSAVAKRDRARLDVDNARQGLQQARIKLDKARQEIAAIGIRSQQAQQNIAYTQGQLAVLTIRSPLTGVLTKKLVNPGVALAPGAGVFTVSATAQLRVSASINELEAGKVKLDLPVEVTMDALPGKVFKGHIYQIAPRAALQDRNEGFTAIRILARLDHGAGQLRPGNTVHTRIILERRPKAVSLPLEAVTTDKQGRKIVFLDRDGKAHAQTVKVGLSDLRFVEITDGLKPMNLVIVSYGKVLEEGTTVAEQKETKVEGSGEKRANPHGI